MGKVDFSAAVSVDASVAVDETPAVALPPRYNLYCVGDKGAEYVTTERANSYSEARDLATAKYPGKEFTDQPPVSSSKLKKRKDSPRKNIFVMRDGQPEYLTTEIADTHAAAKAQAQAKHPSLDLLCEDDL